MAAAWLRGWGSSRRQVVSVVQSAPETLTITTMDPAGAPLANGWWYDAGVGDLVTGGSGVPVASFGPFL